jgi:glucose dehydrogenase
MDHVFFAIAIFLVLQYFWQRLAAPKVTAETELQRIAALQQAAVARRAEYAAAEQERVALEATQPTSGRPSTSRKQVQEAEVAYAMALQAWQNRQSGQKSR